MHPWLPQSRLPWISAIEGRLEAERDQLVLWVPVAIGSGIAAWFVLCDTIWWRVALLAALSVSLCAVSGAKGGRFSRVLTIGTLGFAIGLGLVWWRSERVAAPVLARPEIITMTARVNRIEPLAARELVRLTLVEVRDVTDGRGRHIDVPPKLRVNVADADVPEGLATKAVLRLRARLMPPPLPAVPGAYDFARKAWFDQLGATGRAFAPIVVIRPGKAGADLRNALSRHITERVEGSAGGIAAALATGDIGAIGTDDAEAMRRAGLAHLLSVSGLHITAAVGLTMLLTIRILALSPALALRVRLPLVAGAAGAAAAIGYTLLTGAQVPTIRSCVAALLVLAALAIGREAVTLRLVAAGAVIVLLLWPESLAGPSFQLSFAAITAIIAFHEHPAVQRAFARHDEGQLRRMLRGTASLLITGLLVETALMPIAVYHFHKAGLYGAVANIVAIPLTTFVVMPLEAAALLFDTAGIGAPFWWLASLMLNALLTLAHAVAGAPGSVAALPAMPDGAFALMVFGGLWVALWRTRMRRAGAIPIIAGLLWSLATPVPDILVTGDGRHVAVRMPNGALALLRDRAGDYTRSTLAENSGFDDEPLAMSDQVDARCSRDLCMTKVPVRRRWLPRLPSAGRRSVTVLATRSAYLVPVEALVAACRNADIVVSERSLPGGCKPRWMRLDAPTLRKTGGVAITLPTGSVRTVLTPGDPHPWRDPPLTQSRFNRSGGAGRIAYPGRGPDRGRSVAGHKHDWRGRAGSSNLHAGNI